MNRSIVLAKIRRQQAEIHEVMEMLKEDHDTMKMIQILAKRYKETETLLEAMSDKSVIPKGQEDMDITPELEKISKKVAGAKNVIQHIKHFEVEDESEE